jgi:hypothetical protein
MKTISPIIGGAQALLAVSYDLKGCFEEYLSDEYKTFPRMLRVITDARSYAALRGNRADTLSVYSLYTKFFCQRIFRDRKDQPVDPAA